MHALNSAGSMPRCQRAYAVNEPAHFFAGVVAHATNAHEAFLFHPEPAGNGACVEITIRNVYAAVRKKFRNLLRTETTYAK